MGSGGGLEHRVDGVTRCAVVCGLSVGGVSNYDSYERNTKGILIL